MNKLNVKSFIGKTKCLQLPSELKSVTLTLGFQVPPEGIMPNNKQKERKVKLNSLLGVQKEQNEVF